MMRMMLPRSVCNGTTSSASTLDLAERGQALRHSLPPLALSLSKGSCKGTRGFDTLNGRLA